MTRHGGAQRADVHRAAAVHAAVHHHAGALHVPQEARPEHLRRRHNHDSWCDPPIWNLDCACRWPHKGNPVRTRSRYIHTITNSCLARHQAARLKVPPTDTVAPLA